MEFEEFPKIARLSREVIITEKLDGTNAQVCITDDGRLFVGSRTRWITPQDDNYGFASWAEANKDEMMKLGPGRHFGEWWGRGIQRNYSQTERHYSLFNVSRWAEDVTRPQCCKVVPVLYQGPIEEYGVMKGVKQAMALLESQGSKAAPGFMKPEGIVVFHTAANFCFKKTLDRDDVPKAMAKRMAA